MGDKVDLADVIIYDQEFENADDWEMRHVKFS